MAFVPPQFEELHRSQCRQQYCSFEEQLREQVIGTGWMNSSSSRDKGERRLTMPRSMPSSILTN